MEVANAPGRAGRAVHHPRRTVAWLLALLLTVALGAVGLTNHDSPTAGPGPAPSAGLLAFDLPTPDVLRNSPRKVFAHYVPSLPLSVDNVAPTADYYARNYLTATGEGGIHVAYGGFLRDRPQPRAQQRVAGKFDGIEPDVVATLTRGPRAW